RASIASVLVAERLSLDLRLRYTSVWKTGRNGNLQKLRIWSKAKRDETSSKRLKLQSSLAELDKHLEEGDTNPDLLLKRITLVKSIMDLDRVKAIELAQNAKVKWREWVDDPIKVKETFFDHFADRFSKPSGSRPQCNLEFGVTLSHEQALWLDEMPFDEEIKSVVWECGVDKSPDAKFVKDFCPISLIGCQNKIVEKILAKILSSVIGNLISMKESALIHGRQILDGPMILNEVILKINLHKYSLVGVGVEFDEVRRVAGLIGYEPVKPPFKYLGVLVGSHMSRLGSWEVVARLSKWKVKTLSVGGRLALLKSVLGAIPSDYMSIYKVSIAILKKLEPLRANFFKRVEAEEKKMSWFSWDKVLLSKDSGGLGVSSCFAFNIALLFKWIWHFKTQQRALWVKIVKAIHSSQGKLNSTSLPSHSSTWIDIIKCTNQLREKGVHLLSNCKKKVGDGIDTSFW
ncbi:hypothetical protein Tco_1289181, partial [Tanacetum coccineum]